MPRHINPSNPERTATAPYNFVPLPQLVLDVADGIDIDREKMRPWEAHDRFVPGTHRGWIDLEIETLTPLYIRGAVMPRDAGWDDRPSRVRPEPYTTPDGRPAIPGSSLRGMIRTLVEIISFSKIQPVGDSRPFFRTVASDRIGWAYGQRMRRGNGVRGGFLRRHGDVWMIEPCAVARVARDRLKPSVWIDEGPDYTPPWPPQHGTCWVILDEGSMIVRDIRIQQDAPGGDGWRRGTLVLSGNAPRKRREFVFLESSEESRSVLVPDRIWERFHDDDQITQWQQKAFPRNRPAGVSRKADGHLRDGEPVFYLLASHEQSEDNPDGLVFLGRAGMFRLPFDRGPSDLIPTEHRDARLDLAEVMFGMVHDGTAIKGRLSFEDAIVKGRGSDWFEELLVPRILSAPKPTTFQHYLTQDGTAGKDALTTYLTQDRTTLRGHKLYWHRWDLARGTTQVQESEDHAQLLRDLESREPQDTQHTIIRPVKAGVTFTGRIRFENLTPVELGALLHAVTLPPGCCHRIGVGKPLGLGSIRINSRLTLVDNKSRYRSWNSRESLLADDGRRFIRAFEEAVLEHAERSGETLLPEQEGLRRIARLDALYQLLAWDGRPDVSSTQYMDLERFRDRPVLPTPHHVRSVKEPLWPDDRPRAGDGGGRDSGPRQPRKDGPRRSATKEPRRPGQNGETPARPVVTPKPIQKGQTRKGSLHRRGDAWVARFDGDERDAGIVNRERVPTECPDGAPAEFFITEQSKAAGIKCRFERLVNTQRPKR